MRTKIEINIAQRMKYEGKGYNEIKKDLYISINAARNLCRKLKTNYVKKRGHKNKITKSN